MGFRNKDLARQAGQKSSRAGIPNKASTDVREAFKLLIEGNLEKMQTDLNSLEPKDRLQILIQLSKFVLPQLQAIGIEALNGSDNFKPTIIEIKQYAGADSNLNDNDND